MLQNYRNLQIWNTSVFSPSVSPNFFTLFLDSFFELLCFRFRLTGVSSIILFRARTLVVLRHGVLANWLVECFCLVVPNMVLSKLNIQKLVSQHTRGRYTFQPLWVSANTRWLSLTPANWCRNASCFNDVSFTMLSQGRLEKVPVLFVSGEMPTFHHKFSGNNKLVKFIRQLSRDTCSDWSYRTSVLSRVF